MNKTLFIFPTVFEGRNALKKLGARGRIRVGTYAEVVFDGNTRFAALVSGFGCEASKQRMAGALKKFSPDKIILAGFCGACTENLKNGQIIFEMPENDDWLSDSLKKLGAIRGKIACADHIVEKAEKIKLFAEGFAGVEMEGDFLKSAVAESGQKCETVHIRWISDSLESGIPASFFESVMDKRTGAISANPLKIFWQILRSPKLIFSLLKFAKETAPVQKKYDADILALLETLAREPHASPIP